MVSRKDFEAIAEWVASEELMGTNDHMVERLCGVLETLNPRFDKERFIVRCDELQDFNRFDLGFPIPQHEYALLALKTFQQALIDSEAKFSTQLTLLQCEKAMLEAFPHLKNKAQL